jgi:hypothetical protein
MQVYITKRRGAIVPSNRIDNKTKTFILALMKIATRKTPGRFTRGLFWQARNEAGDWGQNTARRPCTKRWGGLPPCCALKTETEVSQRFFLFLARRSSPDLFVGAKVLFAVSKEVPAGGDR